MRYSKLELDRIQAELYSAVIADILDEIGVTDFCMEDELVPILGSGHTVGYARTLHAVDVFETPKEPYALDLRFIDSLTEGDLFLTQVTGRRRNGYFGELLATACAARGVRGAILDGYARDTEKIDAMGFPLYCRGANPLDSKGRVDAIEADKPIICGGARVCPGDLVFADRDGIVVIPSARVGEVVDRAFGKLRGENAVREELRGGASAKLVFDKYGIL